MKSRPISFSGWCVWFIGVLLLALLIPSAKFGVPLWKLPQREIVSALCVVVPLLASAVVIGIAAWRGTPLSRLAIALLTTAFFGLAFLYFMLTGKAASMSVILAMFVLALLLLPASFGAGGMHRLAIPAVFGLAVAALAAGVHTARKPLPEAAPSVKETLLHSAYYNLSMRSFVGRIPRPLVRGGGIAHIGDQFLLGTGDGHLYLFRAPLDDQPLDVKALPYRVPANGPDFAAYIGQPFGEPRGILAPAAVPGQIESWQFRVADVFVQELGDKVRVFASHHFWNNAEHCMTVRLSMLETLRASFLAGEAGPEWRTIYETHPCIKIAADQNSHGNPYTGEEVGGRIGLLDDHTLLLTLGDLGFSGETTPEQYSQDPAVSYGKIQMIPLDGSPAQAYDMGHRNLQGLYIDPHGAVWSTEHGPQGGDELNRIVKGANYGWPRVTYGTDYGSLAWPLNPHQGRHDGYEKPVYAWLPSIGTSNLIGIEKNLFPSWHGDLVVGSLKAQSLWRVRLEDGHAVLTERIETPRRIRDLIEGEDGRIYIWSDDATIDVIGPAKGTEAGLAFATLCSGCHAVQNGETHGLGPDLRDVVGRRIASAKGFDDYSAALRAKAGTWTERELDAFLASPQAYAPGTRMGFAGIPDAATRAAVIEYLKAPPPP